MTKTTVVVNGKEIKLMDFPERMLTDAIVAMLKTLRGVGDQVETAVIRIESV